MLPYQHLFFDLDRTLWDFEANSQDELLAMFKEYSLANKGISLPLEFIKIYKQFNEVCWELYLKGTISQSELRVKRFYDTLEYFGIRDLSLAQTLDKRYVERSPYRTKLVPNAIEALTYLQAKKYTLHIITNGFEEVQHIKLKESNLDHFFTTITTSEMAHAKKPEPEIFNFALQRAHATKENSVYIGDDLVVDVEGAINAEIAAVFYNPHKISHKSCTLLDITGLIELQDYF